MAQKIKLRNGSASSWTSVNPTLTGGEIGVENDTGRFKVGNGSTAWSSLSYTDAQGSAQAKPYRSFGDGGDGNLTLTTGTVTLTTDIYYNNVTISGTGKIDLNGFKLFIKGTLDLTNAPVDAISSNGLPGLDASANIGGSSQTAVPSGSSGGQGQGTAGANGQLTSGATATAIATFSGNGGTSFTCGQGGVGVNTGGAAQSGGATTTFLMVKNFTTQFIYGTTLIGGGMGGRGGSSGGGDGVTNAGGGGGAGGNGGGVVAVYANVIITSASTSAGVISAKGGKGGNGGTPAGGPAGGGGGGCGGGGGWIYLVYNEKYGPIIKGMLDASGGNGGGGGAGVGLTTTGISATGGGRGQGGSGGTIMVFNVPRSEGITVLTPAVDLQIIDTRVATTTSADGSSRLGGSGGRLVLDF